MTFSKKILSNGLRVITVPMKGNPTVTSLVLVETGSEYEIKKISGLSHFLEHMCFKGTIKRPRAIDISKELDGLGAQYNAFTGQEYTGYYAKADSKHFRQIFDIVSDLYLNPTFPEAEIEKEKGVIVEEINMYKDTPQRRAPELLAEVLYGDQPAGWNIAGRPETVRAMARENFLRYRKDHYVARATIIIVAGAVSETAVLNEVKRKFSNISLGRKHGKLPVREHQASPRARIEHKKTDQTHLALGFRTFGAADSRNSVLTVLMAALGSGMSSRLFTRLREEMGICYYVRAGADAFTDHGYLEVFTGVDVSRSPLALKAILEECRRFKNELLPDSELAKTKEHIIGGLKMGLESSDDTAFFCGIQEVLRRKLETPAEKERKIRAVSARQVCDLARQIFQTRKLSLAIVGPFKNTTLFRRALQV